MSDDLVTFLAERYAEEWRAARGVEEHFPSASGNVKAMLILAYGAGLNAGLAEAQEIVDGMQGCNNLPA